MSIHEGHDFFVGSGFGSPRRHHRALYLKIMMLLQRPATVNTSAILFAKTEPAPDKFFSGSAFFCIRVIFPHGKSRRSGSDRNVRRRHDGENGACGFVRGYRGVQGFRFGIDHGKSHDSLSGIRELFWTTGSFSAFGRQ